MTFDELYPGAALDEDVHHGDGVVFRIDYAKPCKVCGRPTHWCELTFGVRACSGACVAELFNAFFAVCERAHARDQAQAESVNKSNRREATWRPENLF